MLYNLMAGPAVNYTADKGNNTGSLVKPVGNTYREFGADIFNQGNIAREDWQRAEQSAQLSWEREMYASSTAYQRAVADLKQAGLNPILAYQQGGAPSTSGGHSQGSRGTFSGTFSSIVNTIAQIGAGLYTAGANNATRLSIARLKTRDFVDGTYNGVRTRTYLDK